MIGNCADEVANEINYAEAQIIAACPGFQMVRIVSSDEEDWAYECRQVIGWMEYPYHLTDADSAGVATAVGSIPVLAGGIENVFEWSLVEPSGRVISFVGNVYNSVQEWLKGTKNEWRDALNIKI